MSVWSWLRLTAALWLLRIGFKAFGWLIVAAVAVAAWPLTAVAAIGYLAAWLRGWPPARLWRAAAWALPMTAVYAIGQAIRLHAWQAVALAPVNDYGNAWRLLAAGAILRAGLLVAPVAVPAGLAIGGAVVGVADLRHHHRPGRDHRLGPDRVRHPAMAPPGTGRTGPGRRPRHRPPADPGRPGGDRPGHPGHPSPVAAHPGRSLPLVRRHFGDHRLLRIGKTNLMMRLWAGWYAAALTAFTRREGNRPVLVVLDCKGGPDARVKAERTRRLLHGVGARRVAIWPDDARLCLWDLPARDLGVLLLQMIETGTGAAAYYTDVMQAVVNLALAAPGGPPPNAASFLDRLDVAWLETAYGDGCTAPPCPASAPPNPTSATSSSATPRSWAAWPRSGRPWHPGWCGCLVLHPGRHPRTIGRRSPGHGADRTGRPHRHFGR